MIVLLAVYFCILKVVLMLSLYIFHGGKVGLVEKLTSLIKKIQCVEKLLLLIPTANKYRLNIHWGLA